MNERNAWIVSAIVALVLALYYFVFLGRPVSLNLINAVVAFSATFIIGFSFFLGPIARIIPALRPSLLLRKPFGLIGFGFAALHTFLVLPVQISNTREIFLGDVASIAFGAIAFLIFALMSLTSTQSWMEKLGYENWKNLQRLGYLAFAFLLFHIVLLEQGVFLTRLTGQIATGFILLAILLRALMTLFGKKSTEQIRV